MDMEISSGQCKGVIESGTVSKRRKELENKISGSSNQLGCEWFQREEVVYLSLLTGAGSEIQEDNIVCEPLSLRIDLPDGRTFATDLFEEIDVSKTTIYNNDARCFIKMYKKDASNTWTSLDATKIIMETSSAVPNDIKESIGDEKCVRLKDLDVDVSENDSQTVMVHIFLKDLKKDELKIIYYEDSLKIKFHTRDACILNKSKDYSEDTLFLWEMKFMGKVDPKLCSHKVSPTSIEISLKKLTNITWGSPNEYTGINKMGCEWYQKDGVVFVSLLIGGEIDINKGNYVVSEPTSLRVALPDGRTFSTNLYDNIDENKTTIRPYGNLRCLIQLHKKDPAINWQSLDVDEMIPEKSSMASNDDKEQMEDEKISVKLTDVKTDIVERELDSITVHIFLKELKKDELRVIYQEESLQIKFYTRDAKILKLSEDYSEDTLFHWETTLKGKIDPKQCTHKVTAAKIELKLKKLHEKTWGSLTKLNESSKPQVARNRWVVPSTSSIPPAPPAPPTETKKPTCLVYPVSKNKRMEASTSFSPTSTEAPANYYGLTGLENIGNTCFMNSVLQCLLNTVELRNYFLDTNFQSDLNKDNPLGMGGKLAVSFAVVMKLVWQGTHRSHPPIKLKTMMSVKANQFSGFAQHDAQEFMVELLDGLHEDLNRIKNKPYIAEPPDLDGWADDEAANESWRLHKMRNDSIIDDLFKGQFKSTLKCHECDKISVKFDEFCCLSVPIPKDQKVIQVIFFWTDTTIKPKKFYIKVNADAVAEDLKHELSVKTNVSASCMQVIEVYKSKIHRNYNKGDSLASVLINDAVMAFELYNELQVGEPVVEIAVTQRIGIPNSPTRCSCCNRQPNTKLKRCTKCFRASYCNSACQKNHWVQHKGSCKLTPEPVGNPFIISMPESHATYQNLISKMEAYSRHSVDIFQPPVTQRMETNTHHGSTSSCEMSNDEGDEMDVDSEGSAQGGASGVKEEFIYESDDDEEWFGKESSSSGEDLPQLSCSPGVRAVQPRTIVPAAPGRQLFSIRPINNRAQNCSPNNDDILSDKGDEPLILRDKYYAMDWKTNEREPVHCIVQTKVPDCEVEGSLPIQKNKETSLDACIELFTQPENLSEDDCWKCPRCKKPVEATKQMSVWRLPPILIIQLKRFSFKYVLYSDKIDKFVQYPIRELDMSKFMSQLPQDGSAVYDLYGVINHMGRLLGGHYTAYARTASSEDSRKSEIDWRLFDDSRVNYASSESRVVNDQAYLLLYRRRDPVFKVPRPPMKTSVITPNTDTDQEPVVDCDMDEVTPMSISSTSQPSTSSVDVEDLVSTTQEDLD